MEGGERSGGRNGEGERDQDETGEKEGRVLEGDREEEEKGR